MKNKKELEKLKNLNKKKQKTNYHWVIKVTIIAFTLSLIFSIISEVSIPNVHLYLGIIIVIIFILVGIIFDIIGVAVSSCNIKPFHSMNSKKIKGADIAVKLITNAPKVSSVCNDVLGDVCGIISGSTGIIIAKKIALITNINIFIITFITTSLIASLTIGGKAIGKTFAINKNNIILYKVSYFISYFYKII